MTKISSLYKNGGPLSVILSVILSVLFVVAVVEAATTISTNISTDGTLSVTGASTLTGNVTAAGTLGVTGLTSLGQASSTRLSVFDTAYFGGTATSTFNSAGALTIGTSGTAVTQIRVYAATINIAATAGAIGTSEQTFTVTGLTTDDKVFVNGPAPTALCPVVHYRVSAADTLAVGIATLTAVACDPASATYNIVAIRN